MSDFLHQLQLKTTLWDQRRWSKTLKLKRLKTLWSFVGLRESSVLSESWSIANWNINYSTPSVAVSRESYVLELFLDQLCTVTVRSVVDTLRLPRLAPSCLYRDLCSSILSGNPHRSWRQSAEALGWWMTCCSCRNSSSTLTPLKNHKLRKKSFLPERPAGRAGRWRSVRTRTLRWLESSSPRRWRSGLPSPPRWDK